MFERLQTYHGQEKFAIAHISDPHLSRQYYREHLKSFKLLLRSVLRAGLDHIVITGDITSTADPDDFQLAREIFGSCDLLNAEKLTVVPGNHDIFGGPHRAVDVLSFPRNIRKIDYQRGLALFEEAFAETFKGVQQLSLTGMYPFLKNVGPITFLGLNSISPWSLRRNILGSNGELDDDHIAALKDPELGARLRTRIPVALLHHQFADMLDDAPTNSIWRRIEQRTMRMRKRRKISKIFQELGVQYVLHGHVHQNGLYERYGLRFANGAGAVCDDPVRFLKYNHIAVDGETITSAIETLPIPYQISSTARSFHRFSSPSMLPRLVKP